MNTHLEVLRLGKLRNENDPDKGYLFKNVTFRLEQGQTLAVRAPSGSGKTQLLRSIANLVHYEEGKPFLNGKSPEQWGIPRWRSEVLYVSQKRSSLSGTPAEFWQDVAKFKVQRDRCHDLGGTADVKQLAQSLNVSYSCWEQPWTTLSGGEIARVQLAIGLALKPAIILIDEPTAALDEANTRLVESILRGKTCIWVTHSDEQARRVADRILYLDTPSHIPEIVSNKRNGNDSIRD